MSADKEYTYAEVSQHATKKDLLIVIHDNIYNASSFIDEHPGGEEVLLDVAGQDATEAFEDVGHSDEAREILSGLLVGKLNRKPGDPKPNLGPTATKTVKSGDSASSFGIGLYALILIGGAAAYGAWKYFEAQQAQ